MVEILIKWLGIAGGVGVIIFLAGWYVKTWLEHKIRADVDYKYDKEITEFKNKLSLESAKEVEKVKSELAERNFRFSQVFERTADAIEKTYELLLALQHSVTLYVAASADSDIQKRTERFDSMQSLSRDFTNYYPKKRIYIPEQTAKKIDVFFGTLNRLVAAHERKLIFEKQVPDNQSVIYSMDCKITGLENEINESLIALHNEFQSILGFPQKQPTKQAEIP